MIVSPASARAAIFLMVMMAAVVVMAVMMVVLMPLVTAMGAGSGGERYEEGPAHVTARRRVKYFFHEPMEHRCPAIGS